MERLTIPDKKIDGGLRRAVIDAREVRKAAMTVYWALKKYEDTGLTPEEVIELRERDTAKKPVPGGLPENERGGLTCRRKYWMQRADHGQSGLINIIRPLYIVISVERNMLDYGKLNRIVRAL